MIPKEYSWLKDITEPPKVISEALKLFGVAEVVGKGSNATILSWRDELNKNGVKIEGYSDDDIPWCGLFVAICCLRAGKKVVSEPLWARNWTKYGVQSNLASLGDVLTFSRGSGGHVGFYIAEDKQCYHVLGGNQSNEACITRVEKIRLIGCRNSYNTKPASAKPYIVNSGVIISKNES